jgi:hypothetical protein
VTPEEARREARLEVMHEIVPIICGSCGAGMKPEKLKVSPPGPVPNSNWYHRSKDGVETWTCYASPILNLLEREGMMP